MRLGQRRIIRIADGGGVLFRLGHGIEPAPVVLRWQRVLLADFFMVLTLLVRLCFAGGDYAILIALNGLDNDQPTPVQRRITRATLRFSSTTSL